MSHYKQPLEGISSPNDSFESLLDKIEEEQLYKTKEVAAILQCSVRYVQILVELGRLNALRIGRLIRIPGQEIVRFIRTYKEWDQVDL